MPLGNFSVSLSVKDLEASRAFYQKLGFEALAGDPTQGPAHLTVVDPDGNPILLDQHV